MIVRSSPPGHAGAPAGRATDRSWSTELDACRLLLSLENAASATGLQKRQRTLGDAGPTFAAFTAYLGTRADLFAPDECLVLSSAARQSEPLSFHTVRSMLRNQLGVDAARQFTSIDEHPFEVTFVFQRHRATLAEGRAVVLTIVRPRLLDELEQALEPLQRVVDRLGDEPERREQLHDAVNDFTRWLRRQADLKEQAQLLSWINRTNGFMRGPAPVVALCADGVLTAEPAAGCGRSREGVDAPRAAAICRGWLRNLLVGEPFPVDFARHQLDISHDGLVVISGATLAVLSPAAARNVRAYLHAAAGDDPDRTCAWLLRECDVVPADDGEALCDEFRQVVPFRGGGWSATEGGTTWPERLFLQWRLARAAGAVPGADLTIACRGLFRLATIARELDPDGDPLRAAFFDARLGAAIERLRQMLTPDHLGENLARYATLIDIPRTLDDAFTVAADEHTAVRLRVSRARRARARSGWVSATGSMTALVALGVAVPNLVLFGGEHAWSERVGGPLFVVAVALALRRRWT